MVTNCDHLARLKFAKSLPFAFTEHGAIQAANVLASPQAVEMGVYVVRAFVRQRVLIATRRDLATRLDELEAKTEGLALAHDTFSHNTRAAQTGRRCDPRTDDATRSAETTHPLCASAGEKTQRQILIN